jgi:hypothetical protein
MKSENEKPISVIIDSIKNALRNLSGTFKPSRQLVPLQFTRNVEKFDIVQKLPFKAWILRPRGD